MSLPFTNLANKEFGFGSGIVKYQTIIWFRWNLETED